MNLIASAPWWLLLVLGLLLAAAAIEDALRLRISNLTVMGVIATAAVAVFLQGATWAIWENLALFAAILVIGTFLFSAGVMGGGDVKLFAALGLWMNLGLAPLYVSAVLIAGGLLAVLLLVVGKRGRRAAGKSAKEKSKGIPYGIAIAAGGLLLIGMHPGRTTAHQPYKLPNTQAS